MTFDLGVEQRGIGDWRFYCLIGSWHWRNVLEQVRQLDCDSAPHHPLVRVDILGIVIRVQIFRPIVLLNPFPDEYESQQDPGKGDRKDLPAEDETWKAGNQ
jgi:hypothetical protein